MIYLPLHAWDWAPEICKNTAAWTLLPSLEESTYIIHLHVISVPCLRFHAIPSWFPITLEVYHGILLKQVKVLLLVSLHVNWVSLFSWKKCTLVLEKVYSDFTKFACATWTKLRKYFMCCFHIMTNPWRGALYMNPIFSLGVCSVLWTHLSLAPWRCLI